MCFSAHASFTTSALLSVIGLASVKLSKTKQDKLLSYTPLIFALQQLCEGVLWLTLPNKTPVVVYTLAMYGFLFFAFIFWPIWIPFVTTVIEKNPFKKKILMNFLYLGIVTCMLFIWFVPITSISAHAIENHIVYTLNLPESLVIKTSMMVFYLLAVITPLFISTVPYMWVIGLIVSTGYAISYWFYRYALISVWCFVAAVISSFVLWIVCKKKY